MSLGFTGDTANNKRNWASEMSFQNIISMVNQKFFKLWYNYPPTGYLTCQSVMLGKTFIW